MAITTIFVSGHTPHTTYQITHNTYCIHELVLKSDSNRIDAAYNLDKPSEFPFNTDGYDISGNNILIEDQTIYGGGDNITYRNSFFWGGHGASLSAADGVTNVLFDNLTSVDCLYGGE
jgi:hypothetical protein